MASKCAGGDDIFCTSGGLSFFFVSRRQGPLVADESDLQKIVSEMEGLGVEAFIQYDCYP